MEQSKDKQPVQQAVTRAEGLIDGMGLRIGLFAGLAGQRIQSAPASLRTVFTKSRIQNELPSMSKEATQPDQSTTTERAEEAVRQATEKAERVGQRINRIAIPNSLQKAMTYICKGAEDIWAEAQSIRRKNVENP